MLWRKLPGNVAKVGVVGSNPIARSKSPYKDPSYKGGPSGPLLLIQPDLRCNVISL